MKVTRMRTFFLIILLHLFPVCFSASERGTWWYDAAFSNDVYSCSKITCQNGGTKRVIIENLGGDSRFRCRCQCDKSHMGEFCDKKITKNLLAAYKYINSYFRTK